MRKIVLKFLNRFYKLGLTKSLLFLIVIFSSIITLCTTVIQLYTDYVEEVDVTRYNIKQIEISLVPVITKDIWNFDLQGLNIALNGILSQPNISYVSLKGPNLKEIKLGISMAF